MFTLRLLTLIKFNIMSQTSFNSGQFKCHYYLPYYPTRYNVSSELNDFRKVVFDFKDGSNSNQIGNSLGKDISSLNLTPNLNDWWLCAIPASTHSKTVARFNQFATTFCSNSNINNGYNLLTNKYDRADKHTATDRNLVDVLDSISFGNIAGKKILLFDDVYTTGKSFRNVADELLSLGATSVAGLFLAKTHWLEE